MNYKVTFYNNLVELLTERKGNFVNKLKKISSNILDMLGKEIERQYGIKGTTAQKIIQFMLKNAMAKNYDTVTIKLFTDEGDTVLDPFVGSGTTLVACNQLNRNGIGIEILPENIEVCKQRLLENK